MLEAWDSMSLESFRDSSHNRLTQWVETETHSLCEFEGWVVVRVGLGVGFGDRAGRFIHDKILPTSAHSILKY